MVPTTLVEACRVDSVSDWAVPVSAARWTTSSGRNRSSRPSQTRRVGDVADDQLDAVRQRRGAGLVGVDLREQVVDRHDGQPELEQVRRERSSR